MYPVNSIIRIVCQPGYEIVGSTQLQCNIDAQNGVWSEQLPICKQIIYCPFINPPENGLINTNKQSISSGYLVNTTIEFSCIQGYQLQGSKYHNCQDINGTGLWVGHMVKCVPITTTSTTSRVTSTTTSSSTTMLDNSDDDDIDDEGDEEELNDIPSTTRSVSTKKIQDSISETSKILHEPCKIDPSSMLVSYSNLPLTNIQVGDEYIFINATIGNYIQNGDTVGYNCRSNTLVNYYAKCLNGTLFMQQNCNELARRKFEFFI